MPRRLRLGLSIDEDDNDEEKDYSEGSYYSDLSSDDCGYNDRDNNQGFPPPISRAPTTTTSWEKKIRAATESHESSASLRRSLSSSPRSCSSLPLLRTTASAIKSSSNEQHQRHHHHSRRADETGDSVTAYRRRLEEEIVDHHHDSDEEYEYYYDGGDPSTRLRRHRSSGRRGSSRGSPLKLCLAVCALTMVVLSNQDVLLGPGRRVQEDPRQKEVAFPFHSRAASQPKGGGASSAASTKNDSSNKGPRSDEYRAAVAELPKFYLPKKSAPPEQGATGTTNNKNDAASPHGMVRHRGSNMSYARGMDPLPVFGSGSGGDPHLLQTQQEQVLRPPPHVDNPTRPQIQQFYLNSNEEAADSSSSSSSSRWHPPPQRRRRPFSWTTWLSAVALLALVVETGWKEYRQYRMNSLVGQHHDRQR